MWSQWKYKKDFSCGTIQAVSKVQMENKQARIARKNSDKEDNRREKLAY